MMSDKKALTLVFDDQRSLDRFMSFMRCFGEQTYSEWMQGADEDGTATVRFDYKRDNNTILCPLKANS